jgi:hypothetical protein
MLNSPSAPLTPQRTRASAPLLAACHCCNYNTKLCLLLAGGGLVCDQCVSLSRGAPGCNAVSDISSVVVLPLQGVPDTDFRSWCRPQSLRQSSFSAHSTRDLPLRPRSWSCAARIARLVVNLASPAPLPAPFVSPGFVPFFCVLWSACLWAEVCWYYHAG